MTQNRSIFAMILCIFLFGCSDLGKKNVFFVTKTSLGVDVDSKPPTIDIGYDRKEGTVAPVFENGQVLSQMAAFSTQQGLINQAAGQSFATGNAAELMSKYLMSNAALATTDIISIDEVNHTHKLTRKGDAQRYFFGTDTSFGLKVSLGVETGGIPDSLSLGYKRKEVAYVPLTEESKDSGGVEVSLPSLISTAGFENKVTATDSNLLLRQFFATGAAANYLAAVPGIRKEVVPKMIPDTQKLVDFTRQSDFTATNKQLRIEKILLAVDALDESAVYQLNSNPPTIDAATDQTLVQMDPACQRLATRDCNKDGTPDTGGTGAKGDIGIARRMLKFRVVMNGNRDESTLAAWEASVKAK